MKPYPYQIEGARKLAAMRRGLLADEMGLGKTAQVLLALDELALAGRPLMNVLVVCPASLRMVWAGELEKWELRAYRPAVIVPDQKYTMPRTGRVLVIDSYNRFASRQDETEWDVMVLDEGHYIKEPSSKRTKACSRAKAERVWILTGTPVPNRPIEAYPLLHRLWPETFSSYWAYAKFYCAAKPGPFGMDVKGAAHLDDLNRRLRELGMIRRLKAEVLTQLPEKRHEVVWLQPDDAARAVLAHQGEAVRELEKRLGRPASAEDIVKELSRIAKQGEENQISAVRRELGEWKAAGAAAYIRDLLDGGLSKVVVFAHHRAVVTALGSALDEYGVVRVVGGMTAEAKENAVVEFQNGRARVFIGNIEAAGCGLTLTVADTAVFVEMDWRPGQMAQAEDRIHRIGQRNAVRIIVLQLKGSLDVAMSRVLEKKSAVIEEILAGGK